MYDPADTICALSTAPGRSGIAVVRISGAQSLALTKRIFVPAAAGSSEFPARQAVLGVVTDGTGGEEMDQGIVTYFPAPNSYTGEEVVEFSLHGSPVIISRVLELLCANGARLAMPGEFTLRAFLSGRMDLVQAESVRDIIEATTLYQVQVAARQRSGELSRQLAPLNEMIVEMVVTLEAAVEFVDEELSPDSREVTAGKLRSIRDRLSRWIRSFRKGRLIHDGFSMAIVGRPNVGKSSLFNSLLLQDRSIVTEIPGTTRDLVSEFTSLGGLPVRLLDTAGLRDSADIIERMGVDRSLRAMTDADAILLVVDVSQPPSAEDEQLRERMSELSCIIVMNKADLPSAWTAEQKSAYGGAWPCIDVSAKTGAGLDALGAEIMQHLLGDSTLDREGILITNLRHTRCLEQAQQSLDRAARALDRGLSEEYVITDLRRALNELGAITGETSTDDILGEIFSRFCIGK